ncbi:MAG: hypothetical protein NC218_02320 [Acetobacter sp.]|nr:hypothetical protein [Acetobacter sp.]
MGKLVNIYSRTYVRQEDGSLQEVSLNEEPAQNSLSVLVALSMSEYKLLVSGKGDLIFRKSWPTKIKQFPANIYFTIKKHGPRIFAKGQLHFIMHTIGIEQECERAGITEEKFEKLFYNEENNQAAALAWNIRCVKEVDMHYNQFYYIPEKGLPRELQQLERGFAYIIKA